METFKFNKFVEQKYQLDNGLTILYYPYEGYHVNNFGFIIPYGGTMSSYLLDGKRLKSGIAHFLEHRMFDSINGDLSQEFAKIGAFCNAFTTVDRTCYYCSTTYHEMEAFKILYRLVSEFYSTRDRIEVEKNIIYEEKLDNLSSPSSEISYKMEEKFFDTSYLKYQLIGSKEDIFSMTFEDLLEAYDAFYDFSSMILVVMGPTKIEPLIEYINKNSKKKTKHKKVQKIEEKERFNTCKYPFIRLKRDIPRKVQLMHIKFDVTPLITKYGKYKFDDVISYSLNMMFNKGNKFLNEFYTLDVMYNSFSYSFASVNNIGFITLRYTGDSGSKTNKFILNSFKNPIKYLDENNLELLYKKEFGRNLMFLEDIDSTFQNALYAIEKDFSFLQNFINQDKYNIDDILYVLKCISEGDNIKGCISPSNDE